MTEPSQLKPAAAAADAVKRPAHIGLRRYSTAQFLGTLVFFFIAAPLVEELPHGNFMEGSLLTLVLAFGVLAVGRRRQTLIWAAVLVTPAIACRWLNHYRPDLMPRQVFLAAGLVFAGFVVANLLHFILRAPKVNSEVLCAGISGYLLLGLLWTFGYLLAASMGPNAFVFSTGVTTRALGNFDAFYFSFVTLSTVGYGDITPLSNGARTLAMTEAMTGTIYVAVFIARLVALYSSEGFLDQNKGARS